MSFVNYAEYFEMAIRAIEDLIAGYSRATCRSNSSRSSHLTRIL
jgi:hypothetical protein